MELSEDGNEYIDLCGTFHALLGSELLDTLAVEALNVDFEGLTLLLGTAVDSEPQFDVLLSKSVLLIELIQFFFIVSQGWNLIHIELSPFVVRIISLLSLVLQLLLLFICLLNFLVDRLFMLIAFK